MHLMRGTDGAVRIVSTPVPADPHVSPKIALCREMTRRLVARRFGC